MLNLLNEPIFRVALRGTAETTQLSLPALFAVLMDDGVEDFDGLRPHQHHAWHMFLAALGALAVERGDGRIPDDAPGWEAALLGLTDGTAEPWCLVVDDLATPAFLQPPVPEGRIAVLKNRFPTPDALDVLITSSNFDIKTDIAAASDIDEWVYALVSLQTMEGFLGARNYGIARMNGGHSSRAFMGLTPSGGVGAHLRHDIAALLRSRKQTLKTFDFYDPDGLALLWLEPWDGTKMLRPETLDPWFIEICRRVRFVTEGDGFTVRGGTSSVARIEAKALCGVTGDHWMPVNLGEAKSFSLDSRGFSYRTLCDVLFTTGGKKAFRLPEACLARGASGPMTLVARGMARGQGKTEGFYVRRIPFRSGIVQALADEDGRARLGTIAAAQMREVEQIAKALRFACAVVAIGGSTEKPGKDDYARARPFVARLEADADARFFMTLQAQDEIGADARTAWLKALVDVARTLLLEAMETIPCRRADRWRVRARAPGALEGTLWKGPLAEDRERVYPKKEAVDA